MDKRSFLKNFGKMAAITPFLPYNLNARENEVHRDYGNSDEEFWKNIRKDYLLKPEYINLENGYYNIAPQPIMSRYLEHIKRVNYEGSYYMRTVQWENKSRVTKRLAGMVGCSSDQLIITRNTTESLDMIIGGYPWKKDDEAIFAEQDYGSMQDHFGLIAKRYGVVNKIISIPNHPVSDEELVALYEGQITPKTKLIMVCHMINITGQILPVRKICDMAHKHGVEVMVDGAHCIGHIQVEIDDLNCDYYASSLHKWLSTPLGAGMLYVARDKISKIWPLMAEHDRDPNDITRLNHTGTHPVHTDLAIDNAIDYLEMIDMERKEKRLRFLQRYWSEKLRNVKNVRVNTPVEDYRSCGIANVGIEKMAPAELATTLFDEFHIFTVAVDYANVHGCRITPNVYTTTKELDTFVDAVSILASRI
jgi:selenocysteine lyase/cysteine desulfurase